MSKEIKKIEKDLNKKEGKKFYLNVFVASKTNYRDLNWKATKEELINKNIVFLEDSKNSIKQIFKTVLADMNSKAFY